MFAYNRGTGIGTRYLGASDYRPDGSFVTTKWLIILYFPIYPLCSLRVRLLREGSWWGREPSYEDLCEVPLDTKFVRLTRTWELIPTAVFFLSLFLGRSLLSDSEIQGVLESICGTLLLAGLGFWMVVFPPFRLPRTKASLGRSK